jgi:hypothetical protein
VSLDESNRAPARPTRAHLVLALAGFVFVLHALHLAYPREDGYITFRFARNLAAGHGFVWNLGESPIEGFTSLLWLLISAATIHMGADVVLVTQVLGVFAALGTLWLTFGFARQSMGVSSRAACVPVLLLALSGPLAAWAGSSMEMTAFGFTVLLAVSSYASHLRRPAHVWLLVSGLSLFAATLLRPEGLMVFGVLAGLACTVFLARTRATVRHHLVWGLAYTIPLLLYIAWRLDAFEDPLPNTFYQKTGGGYWQHVRGVGYVIFFALFFLVPLVPLPVLLVWEKGHPDARTLSRLGNWLRWANRNEGATMCVVFSLAYCAYNVYVGGDYMPMFRFMVPVLPFLYLLLAPVMDGLWSAVRGARHKERLLVLIVLVAAGGTFIHSTPLEKSFYRKATWQLGNYRGVELDRWYNARFALIGEFFEGHRKGEAESLATRSIGLIGYHAAHLAIHDLSGLTDRHIAHVEAESTPTGWTGHEKWDLDYSFGRLPTYVMLDENLVQEDIAQAWRSSSLADALDENYPNCRLTPWIRSHPDFVHENYEVKTARLKDEVNEEEGYFAFLERKQPPRDSR